MRDCWAGAGCTCWIVTMVTGNVGLGFGITDNKAYIYIPFSASERFSSSNSRSTPMLYVAPLGQQAAQFQYATLPFWYPEATYRSYDLRYLPQPLSFAVNLPVVPCTSRFTLCSLSCAVPFVSRVFHRKVLVTGRGLLIPPLLTLRGRHHYWSL